ncbi:hypothetical protein SAMN05216214_11345 [Atopomonas hussainii]|uniref:Nucleoid-associated protein n=1 Tax=Atopomonas hussainii TaxID=1429083 RepID=A0A1H7QR77_9GAMM|nr:nucleoid-associated protein [Atopomonas hussainii]SEL50500.1 hypothetical protein SAMN05216214_11345 [Atopomonas hussainii]
MIDVSSAQLTNIAVHRVGNKTREEGIRLADNESQISDSLRDSLAQHYLRPLAKQGNNYEFFHETDLSLNVTYNLAKRIFDEKKSFVKNTQGIAKHLYSTSTHPNIASGELVFLLFTEVLIGQESLDALAVLKIESKDDFINIKESSNSFEIIELSGISLSRIQKGALILQNSKGVCVIDNLGKKTKYWTESFLKVSPSATSKSYAKISGSILKGVTSKIEDAQATIDFSERITEKINSSETTTIEEIKNISSQFIDHDSLTEIISGIATSSGHEISENYEFKSKDFSKIANPKNRKIKIHSGVGLIVSNPSYTISKLLVIDKGHGFQTIIDIKERKEQ